MIPYTEPLPVNNTSNTGGIYAPFPAANTVGEPFWTMDFGNPGRFYTGPLDQQLPAAKSSINADNIVACNLAMQPDTFPTNNSFYNHGFGNECFSNNGFLGVNANEHANINVHAQASAISTSTKLEDGRFMCTTNSCTKKFKRRQDLARHQRSKHEPIELFFCRIPGCQRAQGFSRKDKRDEHEKRPKPHASVEQ